MNPLPGIVVAGHICLDIIPDLANLPPGEGLARFRPGHLIEVGQAALSTGGPVSNTGLALHKLGLPTRLMGKIGPDLFGRIVLEIVRGVDERLTEGMRVDPDAITSYTVIISAPGVDRFFLHCPGANNTFGAADIDYTRVSQAALFHFGYPPIMRRIYENNGAELLKIFRQVKGQGLTTSLDMAFPDPASPGGRADWRLIYAQVLPYVDIFMPSIEELLITLRPATYRALETAAGGGQILDQITPDLVTDVSTELLHLGVKIVALKMGAHGLYLRTAGHQSLAVLGRAAPRDSEAWASRELWAPCFKVQVAGTTGSGDATIAGVLSALLRGLSPWQAVTMGVATGACNVEAADALSGIRPWEATCERVAAGWPRLPLTLESPAWLWDDTHQLWIGPNDHG